MTLPHTPTFFSDKLTRKPLLSATVSSLPMCWATRLAASSAKGNRSKSSVGASRRENLGTRLVQSSFLKDPRTLDCREGSLLHATPPQTQPRVAEPGLPNRFSTTHSAGKLPAAGVYLGVVAVRANHPFWTHRDHRHLEREGRWRWQVLWQMD